MTAQSENTAGLEYEITTLTPSTNRPNSVNPNMDPLQKQWGKYKFDPQQRV